MSDDVISPFGDAINRDIGECHYIFEILLIITNDDKCSYLKEILEECFL